MSGPTVHVTLDAQAVVGMLIVTRTTVEAAELAHLPDLAAEIRSVRLALTGALRSQGWTPCEGNPDQWEQRPHGRRGRRR